MPLRLIQRQKITEEVYASLRGAIYSREFAPGSRLDVDKLRLELGVSRTPLKDALNRLSLEGLIRVVPRQGTFVTELRADEMIEICDVRCVLELYAVEQGIPRMTPEQLQRMRGHVEADEAAMSTNGEEADDLAFVAHDQGFHRVLVEAAGNGKLLQLYEALNVHLQMARVYYLNPRQRDQQVVVEHEAILRAYEARDVALAREAVRAHLAAAKEAFVERLR